ncbi:MAG: hypothetical protein LKE43_04670 [Olsenella sp.]|nr:hypothetical protein [Olsenella sp.]
MWRMLGFVKPLAGVMVVSVVCGVAGFCCATGIPVLAAEEVFALAGAGSLAWPLATVCWVLAAMALSRGVLHYVEQRCNHYIAFRLLAHIRDLVFGALRKLAPAKLAGRDRGSLVSTVTSDVELLEVFFAHTISPICIAVLMAIVGAAFLWQLAPAFALVALVAWALVGVAVPLAVSRGSGDAGRRQRDLAGSLSGYVLDGLRGLGEVLQFGAGASRLDGLDARSRELVGAEREVRRAGATRVFCRERRDPSRHHRRAGAGHAACCRRRGDPRGHRAGDGLCALELWPLCGTCQPWRHASGHACLRCARVGDLGREAPGRGGREGRRRDLLGRLGRARGLLVWR